MLKKTKISNGVKNKKGFTLIELLVVVAIMGLLASLAIVALNTARARARDARRVADVKQIQTALELFYMDQYKYPDDPSTARVIETTCLDEDGFGAAAAECDAEGTTYMGKVPSNPHPRTDGTCLDVPYSYYPDETGDLSYHITYCLGHATGDISGTIHNATPAGIADR